MLGNGTSGHRHKYERPRWWVKLPLYLAVYGHEHFYDYRISLQRRYLKKQRDMGLNAARRLARREALHYWGAACLRGTWGITRVLMRLLIVLIGGAN